jgi:hypothetical protein
VNTQVKTAQPTDYSIICDDFMRALQLIVKECNHNGITSQADLLVKVVRVERIARAAIAKAGA